MPDSKANSKLRQLRPYDRLIAVHGPRGNARLLEAVANETKRIYEPGIVICVANEQDFAEFVGKVEEAGGDPEKLLAFPSRVSEEDGWEAPFCFESKQDTEKIISYVQRGVSEHPEKGVCAGGGEDGQKPQPVRLIVQFWCGTREEYLPEFLRRCQDAKVYCVNPIPLDGDGNFLNGWEPRTDLAGWDAVPTSVDFEAKAVEDEGLQPIPTAALFGTLGKVARQTRSPLGYAYVAALVAASVHVTGNSNIRASLYGGLVGDVHTGKSVTEERIRRLLNLWNSDLCVNRTPASDRGLLQLFAGGEFKKRLLSIDEGRAMMSKGSIENSTLISVLCSLWSRDTDGVADKKGIEHACVQLSILANLKVKDESEFPNVFTHATAHGLYDRFLFGVRGGEKWHYTPWDFDDSRDSLKLEPSRPLVPGWIFDRAHLWASAGDDRDRLAELALRVAYITSAVDQLSEVSMEAMDAALSLMEWQEGLRRVYQPAKGSNETEECMASVLDAFEKAPGRSLNWREVAQKKNWYRKFPRSIKGVRRTLETERVIVYDKKTRMHYLNQEKHHEQ